MPISHHRRTAGTFLAGLVLVFGGCGQERADGDQAKTEGDPRRGGTAVIALALEPDVLNPLIRTGSTAGQILSEISDALVEMSEDMTWAPRIARGWELAPDGLSVTFHLRPWQWEDGTPLTAHDVALSLRLHQDPRVASPERGRFDDITAAVALDDSTIRYEFARRLPDPVVQTFHSILPAHLVGDLDPATVGSWSINTRPLSSGEFVLESWDRNRQIVLRRNGNYPLTPPLLERVVYRILPESEARILALEAGQVDVVDGISPADAARLERGGKATIHGISGRQIYYVQWNCRRPEFADAATRTALSLAMDRRRLIDGLMSGYARAAASPVAPALWNHHAGLVAHGHDPDRARALLAAAGWKDADGDGVLERDGVRLEFEILTRQGDPVRENGAVVLRENLRAVGAEVHLNVMELGVALGRLEAGEFDAYFGRMNLNLYGDPSSLVHSAAVDRYNKGAFAHAGVDSLLELALGLVERSEAEPVWHRLQEMVHQEQPAAWLFYPEVLVAVGPRLRDVRPHMLSPYNNLVEWWIPAGERRYRSGR